MTPSSPLARNLTTFCLGHEPKSEVATINIFCKRGKLRICAKCGSKLMNLNVDDYNFALTKMGVKLVVLARELESFSF
jgi:hypothetical protein